MATKGKTETIRLPVGGIVVKLTTPDPKTPGAWNYKSASISSKLNDEDEGTNDGIPYFSAMHAIESLVLGHACAGVDIQDPAYVEGIETAIEACANEL